MGSSRAQSLRLLCWSPSRTLALGTLLLAGCPDAPTEIGDSSSSSGTTGTTDTVPLTDTGRGPTSTGVADDTGTSGSTGGSDTGTQSCCEPHRGSGCDDPELATCVCDQEASCCAFDWDAACVDLAAQCGGCGAATGETTGTTGETTGGSDPVCCTGSKQPGCAEDPVLEACVCGLDSYCCDNEWDDQCVQQAVRACGSECGGMGGEACCSPSGIPGCAEDPALEACVCAIDSYCCDNEWDAMCTAVAQNDCGLACPSGGDCCTPHDLPGCDDVAIDDCVCAIDSYCCDNEWDGICVSEAQYACMAACGLPPPNMGDCCMDQPGPGCGDMVVTDCVCQLDPECCLFPWDDNCIDVAVGLCALECEGVVPLDPCCFAQGGPGCGNAAVETCVCAFDSFCCDMQWDGQCVDEAQNDCMLDCSGSGGTGGSSSTG